MRQSWYSALDEAQTNFRQHLVSHTSQEWRRVNDSNSSTPTSAKGKGKASAIPQPSDVIIHRKVTKSGNVYRAILDVSLGEDNIASIDSCKSVIASPELRKEWDPAVESAQLLEMCDQATRIVKTNFSLGWPARYAACSLLEITEVYIFVVLETRSPYLGHSAMQAHLLMSPRPFHVPQTNPYISDPVPHMSDPRLRVSDSCYQTKRSYNCHSVRMVYSAHQAATLARLCKTKQLHTAHDLFLAA